MERMENKKKIEQMGFRLRVRLERSMVKISWSAVALHLEVWRSCLW